MTVTSQSAWYNPVALLSSALTGVKRYCTGPSLQERTEQAALQAITKEATAREAIMNEEDSFFKDLGNRFVEDLMTAHEKEREQDALLEIYTLNALKPGNNDITEWTKNMLTTCYESQVAYAHHGMTDKARHSACKFLNAIKQIRTPDAEKIKILNFNEFKRFYTTVCIKIALIETSGLTGSHLTRGLEGLKTMKETLKTYANKQTYCHKEFRNWEQVCEGEVADIAPIQLPETDPRTAHSEATESSAPPNTVDVELDGWTEIGEGEVAALPPQPPVNTYMDLDAKDSIGNKLIFKNQGFMSRVEFTDEDVESFGKKMIAFPHIAELLLRFNPPKITSCTIEDIDANPNSFKVHLTSANDTSKDFKEESLGVTSIPKSTLHLKKTMNFTMEINGNELTITFDSGSELDLSFYDGKTHVLIDEIKINMETEGCWVGNYNIESTVSCLRIRTAMIAAKAYLEKYPQLASDLSNLLA